MEKNKMIMIVVAVVVIVAIAAAAVVLTKGNGGGGGGGHEAGDRVGEELNTKDYPSDEGRLWVYGNANEDDFINNADVVYLEGIISGKNKETQLADANADGVIDQKDVDQLKAMINATAKTKMTVYYVDNYFRVAKVNWPVNTIATGFSSGYYAAEVAQVVDKIMIVDEMMGDGWKYLNSHTKDLPSFGDEESPDWEAIIAADVDVYVPGWCEDKADKLAPEKLKGMDVMFMNTSDNWYVKFPNEYIDRSLTTFGYLVQGNMTQVYKWLDWHDEILGTLMVAAATIDDDDKATMIQARNPPSKGESGRYLFIGYNQTNSIHAEWAGVYSIAQHDALLKDSNYPKITMENIKTIIDRNGDKNGKVYFVDNENAGVVQYRDLDVCQADWISSLGKTENEVVWLGISREMGNSALYLIEMIFYQNVMYPGLTNLDYEEELEYFIDTFIDEPDTFRANMHADQWFRSPLDA